MAKLVFSIFIISFVFIGCGSKQPIHSKSALVVFKTPFMKFYDKGFITKYNNHIHLQIFSAGTTVLDIKVYKDKVCQSTFKCLNGTDFNLKHFNSNYPSNFLYDLFTKEKIYFKDKEKGILIKVINSQ